MKLSISVVGIGGNASEKLLAAAEAAAIEAARKARDEQALADAASVIVASPAQDNRRS